MKHEELRVRRSLLDIVLRPLPHLRLLGPVLERVELLLCEETATIEQAEEPVCGMGFRVWSLGCKVQGAGYGLQGSGCKVQGAGCRV